MLSLRKRIEDIPVLAEFFMTEFYTRNDIPSKPISPSAVSWLCKQPWEENVRVFCFPQITQILLFEEQLK
ncbi:AAA-type ATPase lid domain-containing protein [Candidatus Cloacimonas acidaminovorans]